MLTTYILGKNSYLFLAFAKNRGIVLQVLPISEPRSTSCNDDYRSLTYYVFVLLTNNPAGYVRLDKSLITKVRFWVSSVFEYLMNMKKEKSSVGLLAISFVEMVTASGVLEES